MATQTHKLQLELITCVSCGLSFGVPEDYVQKLRSTHAGFYCPAGHSLVFKGKTEEEKLREQLEAIERDRNWYRKYADEQKERREATERSLTATRGVVTRIKNRVRNGVCPCCNRHFADLQRHMESKHPAYAEVE